MSAMRLRGSMVCIAILSCSVVPANAKSFSLPSVVSDITIARDGSFRVVEKRTFDLDGSFRSAFIEIPAGSYSIDDVAVSEGGTAYARVASGTKRPGTFTFTVTGGYSIRWHYEAESELRTFTVSYRVRGAVERFADVAEFYWKFIGDRWDVPTERAVARVHLPAGVTRQSQLHVWGHGPTDGNWRIVSARTVEWRVSRLPAYRFMEGRLTFPSALVPAAPQRSGKRLPAIQAEEEADREASSARPNYEDRAIGNPGVDLRPVQRSFDRPGGFGDGSGAFIAIFVVGAIIAGVVGFAKMASGPMGGTGSSPWWHSRAHRRDDPSGWSASRDGDDGSSHHRSSSSSDSSSSFGSSDSSSGGFSDSGGGGGGGGGGGAD